MTSTCDFGLLTLVPAGFAVTPRWQPQLALVLYRLSCIGPFQTVKLLFGSASSPCRTMGKALRRPELLQHRIQKALHQWKVRPALQGRTVKVKHLLHRGHEHDAEWAYSRIADCASELIDCRFVDIVDAGGVADRMLRASRLVGF
mmetsp:Transcript_121155/g.241333  ORF Transcript_121155/g.241333 Transcript_121155/m.241333 type:complete len:145 (+) Transcript_121155:349-783(+)